MKVIVSSDLEDKFDDYVVVRTLKEVRNLKGVTILIYHKVDGIPDFDVGVFISDFYNNGIKSFIYINSEPSKVIRTVIKGVGGVTYDDEFYLEDEEELNALVEDLGMDSSDNNSLVLSSTQIVKDFIGAFSRGEERIKAPLYLEQVTQAINELNDLTCRQEIQITEMGSSAIEVFNNASTIITAMNEKRKELAKQLSEFEESQNNRISSSKSSSFSSAIVFFPTFKYVGSAKVLNIKEVSPCRYLTSFLLAYVHHIHYDLNKKVKFIIVLQRGKNLTDKYSDYTLITQESINQECLYKDEIVTTNIPKKDVMHKLTHQDSDDVIIVLDRLFSNTDIISGKIKKLTAVSGYSDISKFGLKPEECIFTISGHSKEFFYIPLIKNYPKEEDMQYAMYNQTCREHFAKLDKFIDLVK